MVKGGEWIVDLYRASKRRQAARNLETLRFSKAGTRPHLERIVSGLYEPSDLEAVGTIMADTAGEVESSIVGLGRFHDQIRETFGMEAVELLEKIMHGPSGKQMIRYSLLELVNAERLNLSEGTIRQRAGDALRAIEELNRNLRELHDKVLSIEKRNGGHGS
jgi:hypothetical protein